MAERRMFHAGVVESDAFLDMTPGAQALYFHLGMQADDDGFVNGPRQVCRRCGARMEELQELIDGDFLLWFDGVAVIKHFRMANTLQNDRLKELRYPEIARQLYFSLNRIYTTKVGKRKDNLYFLRMAQLKKKGKRVESKRTPRVTEPNLTEPNLTESNLTESNRIEPKGREAQADRGVRLTDEEVGDLCRIMGLEKVMYYSSRLGKFMEEHNANIKDHYDTILKWWEEDGGKLYE